MRLSLPTLVFALVAWSFTGFSQVSVTYGGLNNPDLPALAGAEYMAKVDDNNLFVSSGSQSAINLVSFDENNLSEPFALVMKWEGNIDGNTLGTVKDIHYDVSSSKLYVAQYGPSMLKVFDVDINNSSLTFSSEITLTGMNYPERIAMTDDLILVTDLIAGTVADLTYDTGLSLISVQDLTVCGNAGQYKDVEISPDGAYMYVTVFSPASVVKFSLAPTGATCEGVIDINGLLGTSLMGDLEFISPTRAQVIACIGSGGVVRMDANGDLVDPIVNSMSLFDPMKSIFIPGDSLLLVQSSGTNGGTYKLESDYSLTQVANTAYMRDYNNELETMAGGNLVRVENHDGFLGLISEQLDGSYDEVVRNYSGANGYFVDYNDGGFALSPNGNHIITTNGSDEIALFNLTGNGRPVMNLMATNPVNSIMDFHTYVDPSKVVGYSISTGDMSLYNVDELTGTTTVLDSESFTPNADLTGWNTEFEANGSTVIAVPKIGDSFMYTAVSGNTLQPVVEVNMDGFVIAAAKLSFSMAPSGSSAVILAEQTCSAYLIELTRTDQTWAITNTTEMSSAGFIWSCDDHYVTHLENDNRIALSGDGMIKILDLSTGVVQLSAYNVNGMATDFVTDMISYNPAFNQIILMAHDWNGFNSQHSQALFLEYGSGSITSEIASFQDNVGNLSGMVNITQIETNQSGNLVYLLDATNDIIHTFGVEDITVGIEEETNNAFLVYPNPTTSNVTLNFKSDFSGVVSVLDNTGRVVSTQAFNGTNLTLDMVDLSTGLYHVRTVSNDGELNSMTVVKN